MKKNSQIEIQKLLDFHEGKLDSHALQQMENHLNENPEDKELLEGIALIYEQEEMDRGGLESFFEKIEADFDQKLENKASKIISRKALMLQIRQVAAFFLLFSASLFLLSSCNYFNSEKYNDPEIEIVGPYDLAGGTKISF